MCCCKGQIPFGVGFERTFGPDAPGCVYLQRRARGAAAADPSDYQVGGFEPDGTAHLIEKSSFGSLCHDSVSGDSGVFAQMSGVVL